MIEKVIFFGRFYPYYNVLFVLALKLLEFFSLKSKFAN